MRTVAVVSRTDPSRLTTLVAPTERAPWGDRRANRVTCATPDVSPTWAWTAGLRVRTATAVAMMILWLTA